MGRAMSEAGKTSGIAAALVVKIGPMVAMGLGIAFIGVVWNLPQTDRSGQAEPARPVDVAVMRVESIPALPDTVLLPAIVAELSLALWLVFKGVRRQG